MTDYLEFYRKASLLEIATIKKYPKSAKLDETGYFVIGVDYAQAYARNLQRLKKFNSDDTWNETQLKNCRILKDNPPKRLTKISDEEFNFEEHSSIVVSNWGEFFRSFCQVRNNVIHGAKFMMSFNLEDRDKELIKACLAFVEFLEQERLISLQ